jgi:hypothetical protein
MKPPHHLRAVLTAILALLALSLTASPSASAQAISISDPTPEDEGQTATFIVSLSSPPSQGLWLTYRTREIPGDAEEGENSCIGADYRRKSGELFFAANTDFLTQEIHINTCDDDIDEPEEEFEVELSDENAEAVIDVGTGRILDEDPQPSLGIDNATVTEGGIATFDVRLSKPSGRDVTFNFQTANAGASGGAACGAAGVDYETTSGSRTIPAGTQTPSVPVRVTVCGDVLDEADEQFRVNLVGVANASGAPAANATIVDDDAPPAISINNRTVSESSNATFTVSLSTPSGRTVGFNWSTVDGTADGDPDCEGDGDYKAGGAPLTIPAGAPSVTITVPVCDDRPDEPTETFKVKLTNLTNFSNATATPQGTATINDDDPPPNLLVAEGLARAEENSGIATHALLVLLVDPDDGHPVSSGRDIDFTVSTQDGAGAAGATGKTACGLAGADYERHSATPDGIAIGGRIGSIPLKVCGDTTAERSERFTVAVSGVTNATPDPTPTAELTIVNDDGPQLRILDASGSEGGSMSFRVTLTGTTSQEVRVDFETRDGTAKADAPNPLCNGLQGPSGNDYARQSGTLVFPPGTQTRTIQVSACADGIFELLQERFTVRLSRPDFAHIAVGDGTGSIS